MDLKHFTATKEEGVYTLYINDAIGSVIQGSAIANEIIYLNKIKAKRIDIEINSEGGSIIDGVRIASEMVSSEVPIKTINKGYAASMAGVIWALGNEREMVSFGLIMFHNPRSGGVDLNEVEDIKEKEVLTRMKDQLLDLMELRCKPSREELSKMMDEETWLNFEEAKALGLINNDPIKYINSPKIEEMTTVADAISSLNDFYCSMDGQFNNNSNTLKTKQMEDLKKQYDALLADKAKEYEAEFATLKSEYDNLSLEKETLFTEVEQLREENTAQNSKLEEFENKVAEEVVNDLIEKEVFKPESRASLIEKYKKDPEGFKVFTDAMLPNPAKLEGEKPPKISEMLEAMNAAGELSEDELGGKTKFEYLQRNDPKKLESIKRKDKALYEAMRNEFIESNKVED